MNKEIYKTCIIVCNELGECIEVFDLKTLTQSQISAYKEQAKQNKAKVELAKQEKAELEKQQAKDKELKEYRQALVIAKLQFNDLVEQGKFETTDEFEREYEKFVLGAELDLDKAPIDFKVVLERVR